MAKKSAAADANQAAGAGTEAGTGNGEQAGAATTTKGKGGRRPGSGEDVLYFNGERDKALMLLVGTHPGQLTSKQVAATLANHPAFQDQKALIEASGKHESFRQRLIKLNKKWVEAGRPELELRRLANTSYDVNAVLDEVAAQLYGTHGQPQPQPQPVPVQPTGPVATPGVAAGGFTGGLIPTA